jgi:hypothetical protein
VNALAALEGHTMKTTTATLLMGLIASLSTPAAHAQAEDPCALLTPAEVQQVFAGAKAGRRDRELEKYGMLRCTWDYPAGVLILVACDEDESAKDGAEGLTPAFLDPLRSDAGSRVRYEVLPSVGAEAVAVVEREDKAKGFMQDGAILVVQRGRHQVAVMSNDLARRERPEALRVFTELGKAIATRLR